MKTNNGKNTLSRDVFKIIREKEIQFVDLKFVDLPGVMQHMTLPVEVFDEKMFLDGIGFDGSSIRGFQRIHESDMLIKPDASTLFIDPFMDEPTVSFLCNITDLDAAGVLKRGIVASGTDAQDGLYREERSEYPLQTNSGALDGGRT